MFSENADEDETLILTFNRYLISLFFSFPPPSFFRHSVLLSSFGDLLSFDKESNIAL